MEDEKGGAWDWWIRDICMDSDLERVEKRLW